MDSVTAEKQRAMLRYHRLRQAAAISRWLLEGLAALAILAWSSDRLTAALAVCAALLRRLPAVIFHPASAFLVGNVIVVTLFAKSGGQSYEDRSSSLQPSPSDAGDAHDQRHCYSYFSASPPPQLHRDEEKEEEEEEEVVVYEDKAVCLESTYPSTAMTPTTNIAVPTTAAPTGPKKGSQKYLPLARTRSSALPAAAGMVSIREKLLRRSETDVGARRSVAERWWWPEVDEDAEAEEEEEGGGRKAAVAEDDNEEFRRRIEAFISKQLRFIEREEESLLLAANGAVVVAVGEGSKERRNNNKKEAAPGSPSPSVRVQKKGGITIKKKQIKGKLV